MSAQVYWTGDGPVYRMLAEIPLPGADTGRPAFVLYLRVTIDGDANSRLIETIEARGFLIQTRGAQAGLTPLVAAAITGDRPGATDWKLRAELLFEDSSRLTAHLSARRADWKVIRFETRTHEADVQALLKPGARPATVMP